MEKFLTWTAWPMDSPEPYGIVHLAITAAGLVLCFAGLHFFRRLSRKNAEKLLFICGAVMAFSELYKQLFRYYIVEGRQFNWWYFPFQLCSVPMYLCLLLPFLRAEKAKKTICTFMLDFNLMGGILALAEPSDLLHPYCTLTLHGLLWHVMLIFIGLYVAVMKMADLSAEGFYRSLGLFVFFCGIATMLNLGCRRFGAISMFYLSPYEPVTQIVFSEIAKRFGRGAGLCSYFLAMICGGGFFHLFFREWNRN